MEKLLLILLAVILPPAAVAIKRGLGAQFVISILLTILAWIPGVIHAIIICLADEPEPAMA